MENNIEEGHNCSHNHENLNINSNMVLDHDLISINEFNLIQHFDENSNY